MKQKLLAVFLALCMASGSCACGSGSSETQQNEAYLTEDSAQDYETDTESDCEESATDTVYDFNDISEVNLDDEDEIQAILSGEYTTLPDVQTRILEMIADSTITVSEDCLDEISRMLGNVKLSVSPDLYSKLDSIIADSHKDMETSNITYALDNTYTGILSAGSGYKAECTISMTNWLRAADQGLLQHMWENVGGKNSVPDTESFNPYSGNEFTASRCAVAFGTIVLRNVTEGFDFTESEPMSFSVGFDAGYDAVIGYADFSSGGKYFNMGDSVGRYIAPKMVGNTWGPLPLMFVFPNAFTPDDPNGKSSLDNYEIGIVSFGTKGSLIIKLDPEMIKSSGGDTAK